MKNLSNFLLLSLVLELVSQNAAHAFLAPGATPKVAPTRLRRHHDPSFSRHTELNMLEGFVEPLSALMQGSSALPQVLQEMTQTLFFPAPVATLSTARLIQTVGEASFAGMLGIAAAQGAFVMKQYQNNPDGGLIVPPGLTVGEEDATNAKNRVVGVDEKTSAGSFAVEKKSSLSDAEIEAIACDTDDTVLSCAMKKSWYHVTTQVMAIALVPLAAIAGPSWGLAAWIARYGHLVHLAVIFGLTHIYDFFRKLPTMETFCDGAKSKCTPAQEAEDPVFEGNNPRVMVLGDSMSVGIGSCEVFDDEKIYDIPLHKEEKLVQSDEEVESSSALPGPIFPRVLAETLSQRFQKPIAWRSAGVDGGSTLDIAEHLMSVVQDEVDKGQAPDLVVVLTGSNDLKHLLDGSTSVKGFRSNLMSLAKEIRSISPKTRVVFPAVPTYRMDKKSVLNVFPLSVFLDSFMGVWDAQKMTVADTTPGVMRVDLKVADVNKWYNVDDNESTTCGGEGVSLIAADGIHPNARCYEKWGEFVGNSLADQIIGPPKPLAVENHVTQELYPSTYGGGFQVPAAFGAARQHQ